MGLTRQEYWGGLPFPSPVEEVRLGNISRKQSLVRAGVWMLLWEKQAELREGETPDTSQQRQQPVVCWFPLGATRARVCQGTCAQACATLQPCPTGGRAAQDAGTLTPISRGHPQRALTPAHSQVMSLWLTSLLWLHLLRLEKEAGTSGNASCSCVRIR